jgi:hypothetical protein
LTTERVELTFDMPLAVVWLLWSFENGF